MKLIIKIAKHYPDYTRTVETFDNMPDALARMEQVSKDLCRRLNAGEFEDYDIELAQ